eukprot:SAG31_NODE_16652_length_701_cov_1.257475_1_plen_146_part_10
MHPSFVDSESWDGIELPKVPAFEELCACSDSECEEWVADRLEPMVHFFSGLVLVQLVIGYLAWTVLERPDDILRKLGAMKNVITTDMVSAASAVGNSVKQFPTAVGNMDRNTLRNLDGKFVEFVKGPEEEEEDFLPNHEQAQMITN